MRVGELTYEEARARHPREVEKILAKLRKSRSREKGAAPEELSWGYECWVSVPSLSVADITSGKAHQDRKNREAMSLDEKVADQVARTTTDLQARLRRWWAGEAVPNPPEVERQARERFEQEHQEQAVYEALPQEEKDRQLGEDLRELSKDPGFVMVGIPVIHQLEDHTNANGLVDGRIPSGQPCPFYPKECLAPLPACPIPERLREVDFSCALARGLSLVRISKQRGKS